MQIHGAYKECYMRRSKGRPFSSEELATITRLLGNTDMTLQEIAMRMSCAKSSIVAINQQFGIRNYQGRRSCWVVDLSGGGRVEGVIQHVQPD